MNFKRVSFCTLLLNLFLTVPLHAQQGQSDPNGLDQDIGFEMGFFLANLLPNQVEGVEEIIPQGGLKLAFNSYRNVFWEMGMSTGNGEGVEWKNLHISGRMDMPIETLLATTYIGFDATYFKGVDRDEKLFGGGHIGGGIMSYIADAVWFRLDMKFNVNPGTSLLIAGGFTFRFPDGGGAGAGAGAL